MTGVQTCALPICPTGRLRDRPRRRGTAVAARRQHRALSCSRLRGGARNPRWDLDTPKVFRRPGTNFRYRREPPSNFPYVPFSGRPRLGHPAPAQGELEKPPKSDSFSYEHRNSGRSSKELTAEHAGQGAGHGAWWAVDARVVASGLYVLSWYTLSCNAAQHLPRAPERVRTLWCMRKGT